MNNDASPAAATLTNEQLIKEVLRRASNDIFKSTRCDSCETRDVTCYGFGPNGDSVLAACWSCGATEFASGLLSKLVKRPHHVRSVTE